MVKLSTGTVVVVGAAMLTEGDLAATDANIPMTDMYVNCYTILSIAF